MKNQRHDAAEMHGIRSFIPILGWLPQYNRAWLAADFVAGLSVWALLVPQGIAYASIAGVPAQYGLYTALGALIGYAFFGTSRQLVTGPSATVAAVSASAIVALASPNTPEWISFTAALAVLAGGIYLLLGLLRMGWISNFLSTSVLEGFVFGFGIGLIIDQSHKILGVPKVDGTYFQVLMGTIREIPQTNLVTIAVGATSIVLLLLMRHYLPKWPRALIVVILGIVVSSVATLSNYGVSVVGTVPTGLPSFAWPGFELDNMGTLIGGALAVIFVGFSESLAAAKEAASKHGYEVNTSQEMVGQGFANGLSGLLGGFVVDGSLSKTTVADLAGQKSQIGSLVTAGLILLTTLFLAGLFTNLPNAVLGAVVIDAALGLIKVQVLKRIRLASRSDFAAFFAAMLGLLFVGVLAGVVIGVILSLLLLIAAASRSPVRRMGLDTEHNLYVDADKHPDAQTSPDRIVAEVAGPLFFADVADFRQSVLRMVAERPPQTVILDLGASSFIDLDGADTITKLVEELSRKGIAFKLARVDEDAIALLTRAGTIEAVGEENVYASVRGAVAAAQANNGDDLQASSS